MKICVFCGGAGTRMWPLSRRAKPKQFQTLIEDKSLFQLMMERLEKGFNLKDIYVVTGKEYKHQVLKQVPRLSENNLVLEPKMRDTAAAVGYAALTLQKRFPDEMMATVWGADHIVRHDEKFVKALKFAENLAKQENKIVKIDVRPTFPSVQTGYIKIGKKSNNVSGFKIYEFVKHVEKPNLKRAREYLESGDYLWNTGYLVWKIEKIVDLYKKHIPAVYRMLVRVLELESKNKQEAAKVYSQIPKTSIDFALFEKLVRGEQLVIESDLGWTDIGAWNVLKEELAKSKEDNVINANYIGVDTKGSLIYGPDRKKLIATIGLKDMIIVDTKDSLLICPVDRAADIKKIVAKLAEKKKDKFL